MKCGREIRRGVNTIGQAAEYVLVTRRHGSWNVGGCGAVFCSLALVTLAIAAGFAACGAWLVLPFAGLEILALGLAFRWLARHADDFERVAVEGDRVVLDMEVGRRTRRVEFQRCWAQLVVKEAAPRFRIALRSNGREIECGSYLDDDGRRRLARELRSRMAVR